jgi:hypothetical protein
MAGGFGVRAGVSGGGRGSGRGGLSRSAPVTYSESSCGNWFALSTCHICTPCSKYWPLLYWKDSYIYCDLNGWTCAPSRSSSVRMVRWPAWAVSLFVCKQLSPFKILISGWAFKVKVHLWPLIKHLKKLSRKHSVIQKCLEVKNQLNSSRS